MGVINRPLASWLAEMWQRMPNPASDLRDEARVTWRAFCPALCYGHVSPWEPAGLCKSPGLKAAQPDRGVRIGPAPGRKERRKHPAQSPLCLHHSLPPFYCRLFGSHEPTLKRRCCRLSRLPFMKTKLVPFSCRTQPNCLREITFMESSV